MAKANENIPGLLLAVSIGITGRYLAKWIPNLGGVTLAIIIGFIVGNIFSLNKTFNPGIIFVEKKILSWAIMLMGLKLELNILTKLGFSTILIIVVMVISTILAGFIIGKRMGLSRSFSILLGVGNGICGSSAIAAVAPVVKGNEEEIGLSISVVNLLGTLGIFLLPAISYLLKYNDSISGLMIGSTLQATGHVVAAGFSISNISGKIATIVKMGRILMLGPVVLFLSLLFGKNESSSFRNVSIPPYIIGFFILSIIGTLQIIPPSFVSFLKYLSSILLTIAMAGIGLKIRIASLVNQGPTALLVGILIFTVQLIVITGLIKIFIL